MAFYLSEVHGRHNTDVFGAHFPEEDAQALHLAKEAAFRDLLARHGAVAAAGAAALIDRAAGEGWGLAVVTNAPRLNAHAMLEAIGLSDRLTTIVVGEECPRGKPDPAPYLHALEVLEATAPNALAFEDSDTGIAAASGAGLRTVGLRSSLDDAALCAAGAALSIADFNDTALGPELARLEGELT